ncbi:MAG TPA: thioredoxin domain-containing protein, partial [Caulobacteraceae bacterium]|nr:thioredoxin domain-containing protein [Caulobacteraceae bacterium]
AHVAAGPAITDYSIGDAHAKVTVIEYGSVSCPHCAHFAANVFPEFKKKWVDTGKVRYVFRETPIHDEMDVAAFRVVHCAGPKNYWAAVESLFQSQDELFKTQDVKAWLMTTGAKFGMDEAKLKACVDDQAADQALFKHMQAENAEYKINQTPTLIVNGKKMAGDPTLANLDAAIVAAESPHKAAPAHKKK